MDKIKTVWFADGRIHVKTVDGKEMSRPLEAFPTLLDATPEQRADYRIGRFGDDIRWECIDEDIHVSSFLETSEPDTRNEVAELFAGFPWLNISEVARCMGIHKSLLSSYIYGMKKPSPERVRLIRSTLRGLGRKLCSV